MSSKQKNKSQEGFTLIELLIATTIFTLIILVATTGIIRIGQLYYKGITQSKTQEAARNISEEFSRAVQFADGVKYTVEPAAPNTNHDAPQKFCLGDTRYTVYPDKKYTLGDNLSGIVAETLSPAGSNCACTESCVSDTRQLLGTNMRVLKLDISQLNEGKDKAWNVNLRLAYGDNDLLSHYNANGDSLEGNADQYKDNLEKANCKNGTSGTSFCAVAQLDTVIKKRLN